MAISFPGTSGGGGGVLCSNININAKLQPTNGPFSAGMWFKYNGVNGSNGAALFDFRTPLGGSCVLYLDVSTKALTFGTTITLTGPVITSDKWYYGLIRWLSGGVGHYLDVLDSTTGLVSSVNSATTFTHVDHSTLRLARQNQNNWEFGGSIAEVTFVSCDIFGNGAAASASTLSQLAYLGPFSFPTVSYVRATMHLPFRFPLWYDGSSQGENVWPSNYVPPPGTSQWTLGTLTNNSPHPPISPNYVRPRQNCRFFPY